MKMRTMCWVLLMWAPWASRASVEDEFGLGSRAIALGGAFAAVADDVTAAYYNPAGLASSSHPEVGYLGQAGVELHIGFQHGSPQLWLKPGKIRNKAVVYGQEKSYDTDDATGMSLGVLVHTAWRMRLSFGVLIYLPLKRYFVWDTPQPSEVQWPRYDDRTQHISILPAASLRLPYGLSIGAGLRVLPEARTDTVVRTRGLDSDLISSGEHATLSGRFGLMAGLLWSPDSRYSLGLVYRHALHMEDYGQTDITGFVPSAYVHRLAHYYMPTQWVLGLALRPMDGALISLELAHEAWSDFLDSYGNRFGAAVFADVWTPRLGLSYRFFGNTDLAMGYSYVPSPVKDGQEWTRFVDNEKHVISVGTQTELPWKLSRKTAGVTIGWHVQVHALRERRFVTSSDSVSGDSPGILGDASAFQSGGYAFNAGFSINLKL